MSEILTELGHGLDIERLKTELIRGACVKQELAILQSRRIGEANKVLQGKVWNAPGGIRRVARYTLQHHCEFLLRYGEQCWADEDFWLDTLEKNPWMRIDLHLPMRIVVDGFRDRSDKNKGADENRTEGRAPGRVATVPCIEHSAVPCPTGVPA